jgi:hypothetical protein
VIAAEITQDFINTCFNLAIEDAMGSPTTTIESLETLSADHILPPLSHYSDADFEAVSFYFGLPSQPTLVYRTGTPWKRPTGLEAYRVRKETRPVFAHPIADIWDQLGPQVYTYLDSINVTWTSIDVVRFAELEKDPGPPVLWIGVKPRTLSRSVTFLLDVCPTWTRGVA